VVSAAQTSLIEMEYAMEEGIAIIIMLTGIAVAIICVILMLYEMNKTLQKYSDNYNVNWHCCSDNLRHPYAI
jgi:hypothetical protein